MNRSPNRDRIEALAAWEAKTFAFLAERGFAPQGASLILAVSGGADSLALLEFWARAGAPRFGNRLHAVHVHHGLRASADRDQALVSERCRVLGVPLRSFRLDPLSRRSGESLEMWGRRERYRCFAEAAAEAATAAGAPAGSAARPGPASGPSALETSAPPAASAIPGIPAPPVLLLTGHHRDDLVETVFQRLERGTGARGLGGIPFRRAPGIVRPLLNRSRAEIEAYLDLLGLTWCEDETNADLGLGRNWHRHRFLPALRPREPDLDARILSLALTVQELAPGLEALEAEAALLERDPDGRACLPAAALEERLLARDVAALRYWMGRLADASSEAVAEAAAAVTDRVPSERRAITAESLREWHRQWSGGTRMLRVPMGPGTWLERRNGRYYWEKTALSGRSGSAPAGKKECPRPGQRIILDNGGATAAWTWCGMDYRLQVRSYPRPAKLDFPGSRTGKAIFDADLFSCTLLVRTRKDGDRFSPLGMASGSRKLKVFLNEEKIPVGVRDGIPLVFAQSPDRAVETLAWVPGHGISHFYKVGPDTRTILEMELICRNP